MDEFIGRMDTQRHVLNLINSKSKTGEPLYGLSSSAIDRWALANQLSALSTTPFQLRAISSELFFLATRSQEPVSSEYQLRRDKILDAVRTLELTLT